MRQQPTFYRLDRSGAGNGAGNGRDRHDSAAPMMVPLPPGWLCLQDCNLSGQLNQPVVVPFVLMHPDMGVALVDIAPGSNPEAEPILRRRLEAARFDRIFPGFLPVLHVRLDRADLPATEIILRDAFAAVPPLSVPGGDGWISVVRRALLPRDPTRGATHPGLSSEHFRRAPQDASAGAAQAQDVDTESEMLHREARMARPPAPPSYETEVPVPPARPSTKLPWIIMSAVGGLIAVLALFSLLNVGSDAPTAARDLDDAPAATASAVPAGPPPLAGAPTAGPSVTAAAPPAPSATSGKPPAAPSPPVVVAAPLSNASGAGASAPPVPSQRPAPPIAAVPGPPPAASPVAAAAERLPRVTVRQPANLRTAADGQANVLRVVPRGETLRVYGRAPNGWVHVGDTEARGWLHTSRLGEIVE
jgi:hypothetical protein